MQDAWDGIVSSVALVHTVASGDRMYAERWPSLLCRLVQPETTDAAGWFVSGVPWAGGKDAEVQDGMQDAWDGRVSSVALVHTVTGADRFWR